MKTKISLLLALTLLGASARAQDGPPPSDAQDQKKAAADAKAAELKVLIEQAKKRQEAVNQHNNYVMSRWTYAVCIGCGPLPRPYRFVFTNPLRVLAGITAADDDAAAQARRRL